MPDQTTAYNFNLPIVGADNNLWGGFLNDNWSALDDLLSGVSPLVNTSIVSANITGSTIDSTKIGGTTPDTGAFTTITATGAATFQDAATFEAAAIFEAGIDLNQSGYKRINFSDTLGDAKGRIYYNDGVGMRLSIAAVSGDSIQIDEASGNVNIPKDLTVQGATTVVEPTEDLHAATKKYVDDNVVSLTEFHDPTGAASWRIIGNTLECWGEIITEIGTLTLPKSFANNKWRLQLTGIHDFQSGRFVTEIERDTRTVNQATVRREKSNGDSISGWIYYHAIGEWDGVS